MAPLTLLVLLALWKGAGAEECGYWPENYGLNVSSVGVSQSVGVPIDPADKWPGLVSLKSRSSPFCRGSIVHSWWVLSAAHCFANETGQHIVVTSRSNLLGRDNVTHSVHTVRLHPLYNPKTRDNDIALLLLDGPVIFDRIHSPLCLPNRNTVPNDPMWEDCFVAGWGLTTPEVEQGSVDLLDVDVEMMDWTLCQRWRQSLTRNMLCGKVEEGGRDACQGDSGGPLMCRPPNLSSHQQWFLVGIASWGHSCTDEKSPGVYTRVSGYRSWMEQTAARDGHPFPGAQTPPTHAPVHATSVSTAGGGAHNGGCKARQSVALWVGVLAVAVTPGQWALD
ncbi:serine protease 55-like [Anolis sagrei]|uniref:serine protease 55-like n=1 Tax=Anolis sagrei TaxID=38937 RepID=UPI0035218115